MPGRGCCAGGEFGGRAGVLPLRARRFGKIQLHCELVHLALQGCDAGLVFSDDAGFGLLVRQLASVDLRQPQLDKIRGDVMAALRIAPPDDASPNIWAELQLERHRMPTVGPRDVMRLLLQGPSSVSDLRVPVVQPAGFTPEEGQSCVEINSMDLATARREKTSFVSASCSCCGSSESSKAA